MPAGGCSKANGRKKGNLKRRARKRASWLRGEARKTKNRKPSDPLPKYGDRYFEKK